MPNPFVSWNAGGQISEVFIKHDRIATAKANGKRIKRSIGIGTSPAAEQGKIIKTVDFRSNPNLRATVSDNCYKGNWIADASIDDANVYGINKGEIAWTPYHGNNGKLSVSSLGGTPHLPCETTVTNLKAIPIYVVGVTLYQGNARGDRNSIHDIKGDVLEGGIHTIFNNGPRRICSNDIVYAFPNAYSCPLQGSDAGAGCSYQPKIDIKGINERKLLLQTVPIRISDIFTTFNCASYQYREEIDTFMFYHDKNNTDKFMPPSPGKITRELETLKVNLEKADYNRILPFYFWLLLDLAGYCLKCCELGKPAAYATHWAVVREEAFQLYIKWCLQFEMYYLEKCGFYNNPNNPIASIEYQRVKKSFPLDLDTDYSQIKSSHIWTAAYGDPDPKKHRKQFTWYTHSQLTGEKLQQQALQLSCETLNQHLVGKAINNAESARDFEIQIKQPW